MPDWTAPFAIAAGSVVGHEHVRRGPMFVGANNQDARVVATSKRSGCLIGVVLDGCSSHERSEIGAIVSASSVWKSVSRMAVSRLSEMGEIGDAGWDSVRYDLLTSLSAMGAILACDPEDYIFATVIGFVISPETTTVFHIGDGFYAVNGELERLLPASGNRPPYPVYDTYLMPVTDEDGAEFTEQIGENPFSFRRRTWPTSEVSSVLIASDGFGDLVDAEGMPLPFQPSQSVPNASSFSTDDTWYSSPHRLTHFLAACNNDTVRLNDDGGLDRRRGLLSDDTTIVVARRIEDGA